MNQPNVNDPTRNSRLYTNTIDKVVYALINSEWLSPKDILLSLLQDCYDNTHPDYRDQAIRVFGERLAVRLGDKVLLDSGVLRVLKYSDSETMRVWFPTKAFYSVARDDGDGYDD